MKRRNLQAILAVILCMLLLIGCTNKTSSSDASTDTEQNSTDLTQNNSVNAAGSEEDTEDIATSQSPPVMTAFMQIPKLNSLTEL